MSTPLWHYSIMLGTVGVSLALGSFVRGYEPQYFAYLLCLIGILSGLSWGHSAILAMQHANAGGIQSTFQEKSNRWNYAAALLTAALAAVQVAAA